MRCGSLGSAAVDEVQPGAWPAGPAPWARRRWLSDVSLLSLERDEPKALILWANTLAIPGCRRYIYVQNVKNLLTAIFLQRSFCDCSDRGGRFRTDD